MDKSTLFLTSETDDPAFNLAAEEVLLRDHTEDIIFLYINREAVIVGKHQNTLSEINLKYLEENHIPVFRRLSGGGTVYHDHGNINYCLIENGEPGKLVDFVRATTPVVEALKGFGIEVRHGKRNDLLAGYKKISGNACHVYKSRSMHHGTLLYKTNLKHLTESLKTGTVKFRDKSVKSVRSEVINISDIIQTDMSPSEFMQELGHKLAIKFKAIPYNFTDEELHQINQLKKEKYETWEWNYGYSPVYEFRKRSKSQNYIFSIKLKVEKGIIKDIDIQSNFPDQNEIQKAQNAMKETYHEKNHLKAKLNGFSPELTEAILQTVF
ncbi:MAG: lipoate---protein ligase [Anaerophaga sp.]|nr:lipoate---protein ligase [Anaerophaga sp.]MDN5290846.1 lipoate---protein ligase [Anaerophaga sp.]